MLLQVARTAEYNVSALWGKTKEVKAADSTEELEAEQLRKKAEKEARAAAQYGRRPTHHQRT